MKFRNPSPASQAEYKAPEPINQDPTVSHYHQRDSRRNIAPAMVSENPIIEGKGLISSGAAVEIADVPKERPPRMHDFMLGPSNTQPSSDGYFPVVNYK